MAFPLGTVLSAAPGIISAATEIIGIIRNRKTKEDESEQDRVMQLEQLSEKQAKIIEELAMNNSQLALAVRNNRILTILAIMVSALSVLITLIG